MMKSEKNLIASSFFVFQARVMRNLRKPDANGIGESKEYGFVSFTSHEDALKALRSVNNNPNIFSKQKVYYCFLIFLVIFSIFFIHFTISFTLFIF